VTTPRDPFVRAAQHRVLVVKILTLRPMDRFHHWVGLDEAVQRSHALQFPVPPVASVDIGDLLHGDHPGAGILSVRLRQWLGSLSLPWS